MNSTLYNYYYQYFKNNPPKNFVYFIDSVADLTDYNGDFLKNFINYQISFVNPDYLSAYDVYLKLIKMTIDDSFVFNGGIYYFFIFS